MLQKDKSIIKYKSPRFISITRLSVTTSTPVTYQRNSLLRISMEDSS